MRSFPVLAAALWASGGAFADLAAADPGPAAPASADPAFQRCLAELRAQSGRHQVRAATFDAHLAGRSPDPGVLAALDYQPEFRTPIWDYLAALVDAERVDDGRRNLERHADTLAAVDQRYGVDAATVVAVWGVESDYGQTFGTRPLLTSLATLACAGRRQPFFRGELFAALRILQAGHVAPEAFTGSWAGAFGHTQFMPSTFERIAVDFDGDGRRDLVGSVPDALASTARYLQQAGWRQGEPWGFEVRLPADFDPALAQGRKGKRPLSHWAELGLARIDGRPLAASDAPAARPAGLLLPAGDGGPAFLVFRNFDAIWSYNAADSYALAIALLSDRLRGGPGLVTPWPTEDPGLDRAGRRELQRLLAARGHDIGEIDGMIGERTRAAIAREQQRLGIPGEPRAGRRILEALRTDDAG